MYSLERKSEIINLIEKNGSVNVAELASFFHTSKETIRRDLRELEQDHALTRTHGGAIALQDKAGTSSVPAEFPVSVRGIRSFEEKNLICKKAASYIQPGDTVFVDNSSTTINLAQYVRPDIQVTFITNSLKFLIEASKLNNPNQLYLCLGGLFKSSNLSVYGNTTLTNANEYYPDKMFLSCAGISPSRMLTDSSVQEIDTKKLMISHSKEVFVLADYSKFGKDGPVFLSSLAEVDHIITDPRTDLETCHFLDNYNIELISADL